MTLVRFPGALKEFGGASPAFRLPIQTKASTTWLGEETPKREERAAAMALQIDGWKEGQQVLMKEDVYALNKEMTMQEGLDGDGKQWWLGTPSRLKQLSSENIGGILTLSSLRKQFPGGNEPGAGKATSDNEQLVIICSAMPSGTAKGSKYPLTNSKLNHQETDGSETQQESLSVNEDPVDDQEKILPSGFEKPHAIVPVLACISRQTRAHTQETREDWFADIKNDMIIFPRGDKLLQPVLFVVHEDDLPPEGAAEHELIGGKNYWEGKPAYQLDETPVLAYATSKDLTESTTMVAPFGRCFFLPPNHGMPLGLPFHPRSCTTAEQLKALCMEFTGHSADIYEWMDDNHLLNLWLRGCDQNPEKIQTETWIMSQATDTWENWKSLKSLLAQQTFNHPELLLRSRILWDHLVHTLEPSWRDKLLLLGQNAQTIFNNSPEIAAFRESRMEHMWYLAGLINIKTPNWCSRLHTKNSNQSDTFTCHSAWCLVCSI